jgi:hypothetical protein
MLAPRDRRLLLEALRPPAEYELDRMVGTTYSVDLLALLTAPLAFTFFDWEESDGRPTRDPIALLEAVRRHSHRIHLFHEAGRISVPKPDQRLLAFLEPALIPARARADDGSFHAKTWTLRYTSKSGPVRYRFVCLSRNATFDRSWDAVVVLDGELEQRQRGFGNLQPLGAFLEALPGHAIGPIGPEAEQAIGEMAREIRRVRFDLPPKVKEVRFHPLGVGVERPGVEHTIAPGRRPLLVISPFVRAETLRALAAGRRSFHVVSRQEELDALPPDALTGATQVHVLDPVDPEIEEPVDTSVPTDEQLAGLHAKIYVIDDGWHARVFLGSANATPAGFGRNVEFLVELRGLKSALGIDAILGSDDRREEPGLRALLQPYLRVEPPARDPLVVTAERTLELARRAIARAPLRLLASATGSLFDLTLDTSEAFQWPGDGVRVRVWPSTLPEDRAVEIPSATACWRQLTLPALSAFLVVRLDLAPAEPQRFVVKLPLDGAPDDRREQLLRHMLGSTADVLRLIALLLARDDLTVGEFTQRAIEQVGSEPEPSYACGLPLLESLVQSLAEDPERLAAAHSLVEDLRRTEEGRKLLPQGFEAIWDPVWAVYQEGRR